MRCLCLAGALERSGARIWFICREMPGDLTALVEREGFSVIRLPAPDSGDVGQTLPAAWARDCAETRAALEDVQAEWLIVDHYGLGAPWERAIRGSGVRVLVIDDLADRPHECDVLLDQNYAGSETNTRYTRLVPDRCRLMLGPRYALLQPQYVRLRSALVPRRGEPRRVLVFFGGTDATNETAKALRALATPELADLAVDVVLGANHPAQAQIAALVREHPRAALYRDLPTLAGLMFRADLALGAGGTATSERLCLGLPSVVVTVAHNQENAIACLAQAGAVLWAGRADEVTEEDLRASILRAVRDPPKVPPLVDGYGAARVSAAVSPPAASLLRLTPARIGDAGILFDWRNEPTAREMSFDGSPIEWDSHVSWLEQKLADPNARIYIGRVDGLPVGYARLDARGPETVVSYGVDADFRGLGFGKALIESAVRAAPMPATGFRAHVKLQNEPSMRIFRSLGWHETRTRTECIYRLPAPIESR